MAAATGFLVSVLELACTGQIYLPTLIFISHVPELRANALIYLLVYNFMFVIPLIVVFSPIGVPAPSNGQKLQKRILVR